VSNKQNERMATRNKTDSFKELRDKYKSQRRNMPSFQTDLENGKSKLIDGNGRELDSRNNEHRLSVAPAWMTALNDIQYDIERIKKKMTELKERHSKHLLPGFDERIGEEQAIEILTADLTGIFHQCRTKIKKLGKEALPPQENEVKENIQASFASQLQSLSIEFRKIQRNYLQRLRGVEKGENFLYGDEPSKSQGKDQEIFVDHGMTQTQLDNILSIEMMANQREADTRQIYRSVVELADIFKDLAVLVVDQGTILDRIDYNIEQASMHTQKAVVELQQARGHQKSARTKYCIILLCVLIMALLIIIVLKAILGNLTIAV